MMSLIRDQPFSFLRQLLLLGCLLALSTTGLAERRELTREDIAWLNRITYGITSADLAAYKALGRRRFLERQLDGRGELPGPIAQQIAALQISQRDGASILREAADEKKRVRAMPEGEAREMARKAFHERENAVANEAAQREILRAIYSTAQLQEQLVWFWTNHFSVHRSKAAWVVGDYVERAIRPHTLGRFRDLVLATVTHPAMLEYLDNTQNVAGRLNENYARELLELHTLGVTGGYSQQDVQELARILTGAGITVSTDPPKLKEEWQPLYRREGAFEFNPGRHDFGAKTLLGKRFPGSGFDEIEQAVDFIVTQPACARFISRRLATYFVADDPPERLIERMSKTFVKTQGDIRSVLEVMFSSNEFRQSLGGKFRDPMQYVVAGMRLAYDGKPITNVRLVMRWLDALGEPLFGRPTPDGYPLVSSAWTSSSQLSWRFDVARVLGKGNAELFQTEGGAPAPITGFPQLSSRMYFDAIEPLLAVDTRSVLDRAASQAEWNTFLLASPDLNYH